MKLHYRKLGQGSPLFILHGLFGLSDNWATIGKMLSEFFTVYLIDLRNHGYSPHNDEWTYPVMANDIIELIENVLKDKQPNDEQSNNRTIKQSNENPLPILMGHSLGGKVAMQFAAMYPEKLERLIVVDMAPKEYPMLDKKFLNNLRSIELEKLKSRREADEKISSFVKEPAVRRLLSKNLYRIPHPHSWRVASHPSDKVRNPTKPDLSKGEGSSMTVQTLSWKFNLKVIAENQNKIEKTFSLGKKQINIPTLFIKGEKSNHIDESDIPAILKIFPLAEFKTVKGAGHWIHADKPKEFAECIIREFQKTQTG